ncbi:porin, partial [Pseudomonadota bacterium]
PEISTIDDYYVDTGAIIGAEKVVRLGLEAHKQIGPVSWQSEFITTAVKRSGFNNVNFWGAYTYFSWFLSGESRNYDAGTGRFLTVVPKKNLGRNGKGAFEIAARASYVDLTDEDIIGGQQSNVSVGLNWYLNPSFRVMTNLIKVLDVNRPGSEFDGKNPLIFSLRVQWIIL